MYTACIHRGNAVGAVTDVEDQPLPVVAYPPHERTLAWVGLVVFVKGANQKIFLRAFAEVANEHPLHFNEHSGDFWSRVREYGSALHLSDLNHAAAFPMLIEEEHQVAVGEFESRGAVGICVRVAGDEVDSMLATPFLQGFPPLLVVLPGSSERCQAVAEVQVLVLHFEDVWIRDIAPRCVLEPVDDRVNARGQLTPPVLLSEQGSVAGDSESRTAFLQGLDFFAQTGQYCSVFVEQRPVDVKDNQGIVKVHRILQTAGERNTTVCFPIYSRTCQQS